MFKVIDMHFHVGPEILPRRYTPLELAREVKNSFIEGVVLKSHFSSTAEWVLMSSSKKLIGSITLNRFVGGLNKWKVGVSMELGAKVVWFPTIDAEAHVSFFKASIPGGWANVKVEPYIVKFDERKAQEVIDVVSDYGGVVCTGHLGLKDVVSLLEISQARDVPVILTHPIYQPINIQLEKQLELIEEYNCFAEYSAALISVDKIPIEKMALYINSLPKENLIISSDFGLSKLPPIEEGWKEYIGMLKEAGVKKGKIKAGAYYNPKKLLL